MNLGFSMNPKPTASRSISTSFVYDTKAAPDRAGPRPLNSTPLTTKRRFVIQNARSPLQYQVQAPVKSRSTRLRQHKSSIVDGMRTRRRLVLRVAAAVATLLVLAFSPRFNSPNVSSFTATYTHIVDSEQFLQGNVHNDGQCHAHVTISTAYYNLGKASKHSSENFAVWNERFFRLPDNMVIFTDATSMELIRSVRRKSLGCTVIVIQDLYQTRAAKMTDWTMQYEKDHEKYHSPELYILWSQKSFWLASTSVVNPFHSSYFFWADSGQFRDDVFTEKYLKESRKWISYTDFIPRNKVVFLSIEHFTKQETSLNGRGYGPILSSRLVRLGGGNFGGNANAVRRFAHLYAAEVERYLLNDAFIGKDQPLYGSTCVSHADLCFMVDAQEVLEISDPWFAMQPVLHGVTKPVPEYCWQSDHLD